jgi:hypothetical protein
MNLESRLNKIERAAAQSEMSDELFTAIPVDYGASDQYRVSRAGQDGARIMSRAEVDSLPGRIIVVEYVENWRDYDGM